MDTINKVVDAFKNKDVDALNKLVDNMKYFRS